MVRKRKKIFGTAERPRLAVSRSLQNVYAQIINDVEGKTLVAASSLKSSTYSGNIAAATAVGKDLAAKAKKAGIKKVVFDRGRLAFHGRIKALATAAREGGLEF